MFLFIQLCEFCFVQVQEVFREPFLVKALGTFCLTMSNALVLRPDLLTVQPSPLTTVCILKMPVLSVPLMIVSTVDSYC